MNWIELGRFLIIAGAALAAIGVLFLFSDKLPLGKLPGDLHISRQNAHFFIPLTTCILVSIVVTLIINFFSRK